MEKRIRAAYDAHAPGTSGVRIDENGKASDMDPRTVMSNDGCNPVNRDQELARAHEGDGMLFPGILPGTLPAPFRAAFRKTCRRFLLRFFPAPACITTGKSRRFRYNRSRP